jgi:hypothetical protein
VVVAEVAADTDLAKWMIELHSESDQNQSEIRRGTHFYSELGPGVNMKVVGLDVRFPLSMV